MGCASSFLNNPDENLPPPTDEMPKEKTVSIHVTYNETKRIISFRKGGNVTELKNVFLEKFSDVLSPNVTPEQVKLQRYDEGFKDFVDLDDGYVISKDLKVVAHITENRQPSRIQINTKYQLWSPVSQKSDGLLARLPNTNNKNVACSGSFGTGDNTCWTTVDKTQRKDDPTCFAFVFKDATTNKKYALKGNGEGNEVTTEEEDNITDKSDVFQPTSITAGIFSWLKQYDTELYLGCDHEGKVTLVKDGFAEENPSSQVLFSFGKVGVASNN